MKLPEEWNGKIICGFAGIGKSTLAKKYANVVDLESTSFEKDWVRYAKVARHMAKNGYTVLLSCHKEIREELHSGYYLAIPRNLDRIEYMNRYKQRGNDETFITMMNQNWDKFLERLPHESGYLLIDGNLEQTLVSTTSTQELNNIKSNK
jgi:adenylate kinase family enzyme